LRRRVKEKCQEEEREVRDWEREEPRGTGKFFAIISRVSRSLQFVVWLGVGESSVSVVSSTRRPEAFSRSSWRT
jgi:hypothetical protein